MTEQEKEQEWDGIFARLAAKEIDEETAIRLLVEADADPGDARELVSIAEGGSDVKGMSYDVRPAKPPPC